MDAHGGTETTHRDNSTQSRMCTDTTHGDNSTTMNVHVNSRLSSAFVHNFLPRIFLILIVVIGILTKQETNECGVSFNARCGEVYPSKLDAERCILQS